MLVRGVADRVVFLAVRLLINIGSSYPLDIDQLRNGDVKFAVGLGSKVLSLLLPIPNIPTPIHSL